jgi:hypothetical protein
MAPTRSHAAALAVQEFCLHARGLIWVFHTSMSDTQAGCTLLSAVLVLWVQRFLDRWHA